MDSQASRSHSGLLNGPGALGARGARCRVLLKGKGRKTTGDSLPVLFGPAASLQRDGDMDPPCRDALCIGLLPSNHNNRPDGERAGRTCRTCPPSPPSSHPHHTLDSLRNREQRCLAKNMQQKTDEQAAETTMRAFLLVFLTNSQFSPDGDERERDLFSEER
ncbi:hypothetical protein NQZ68_001328 [Dissostichus eleginoides]|nr:hypothetical protein NQZ68_001328 [Dissostichus eleginoides]